MSDRSRVVLLVLTSAALTTTSLADNWPSFRGPGATGVLDGANLPNEWDGPSGKNIKWKTAIPGLGHSCPITWGDKVFITTAVSDADTAGIKHGLYGDVKPVMDASKHAWKVLCLNRLDGKVLWEQTAIEGVPKIKRHTKATHANSTCATDGQHVVAFFGSEGLYCYDLAGKLLWKQDLGVLDAGWYTAPDNQWEYGSSPIIWKELVIVQCDVVKDSFLAAFDVKNGREVWRTPRSDVPTWSSPTVHESKARSELVVNGMKHMGGYDPRTGKELWKLGGGSDIPVPTPFVAHDLIFLANSHGPPTPVFAVKAGVASGDISLAGDATSSASIAWSRKGMASYIPTPLVYGDHLYILRDNGIVQCANAKTGESIYKKRLGQGQSAVTASPVAADGRLYCTTEDGDVYVVKCGAEFELLATNKMGEVCLATPAISPGVLLIRTTGHLFGIGN